MGGLGSGPQRNLKIGEFEFSERELEFLLHYISGKALKECGALMDIEISTIYDFRKRAYKQANVDNVIDLAKFAIRNEILTFEEWMEK